jgi:hypothetical protein
MNYLKLSTQILYETDETIEQNIGWSGWNYSARTSWKYETALHWMDLCGLPTHTTVDEPVRTITVTSTARYQCPKTMWSWVFSA